MLFFQVTLKVTDYDFRSLDTDEPHVVIEMPPHHLHAPGNTDNMPDSEI
jgi:hypothetical protein